MANPEHLAILKKALDAKDIQIWNRWRAKHPVMVPDLSNTDLWGANLAGADLAFADLSYTKLWNAELSTTRLIGAKLTSADLTGVNLNSTQLWGANLTGANLTGAKLRNANLTKADLTNTNFKNAACGGVIFGDVDLSKTLNLNKVTHFRPSTIGIDSLYKSGGNLPDEFLIGCGGPKSIVEFAHKLQKRKGFRLFISHSRDLDFCKKLTEHLRDSDLYAFYDDDSMQGGIDTTRQLQSNIMSVDKVIVVVSEHSMNSEWVREEIRLAAKREREENRNIIFPIRLVTYPAMNNWSIPDIDAGINNVADSIRSKTIPDFQNWRDTSTFNQAFEKLLADLQD